MSDKLVDLLRWAVEHVNLRSVVSTDALQRLARSATVEGLRDSLGPLLGLLGYAYLRARARTSATVDRLTPRKSRAQNEISRIAKVGSGIAAAAGLVGLLLQEKAVEEEGAVLPKRDLGPMGFKASILGMGGTGIPRGTEAEALLTLQTAHECGINYYDTASQYGNGESERRLGLWLEKLEAEGRRGEVFVATKTLSRSYDMAASEIEFSLSRLKTKYIDLLQVHSVNDLDTWRTVTSRSGSLKSIEAAKASGRVRHIGITGHKDPSVIMQAIADYPFDSVLMPLGITDRIYHPFEEEALPACVVKGISRVAMKVFAEGKLIGTGADLEKCLHYVLSLPVSTAIIGMASPTEVLQNTVWTKTFVVMTEDEKEELANAIEELIDTDVLWWKH